MIDIVKLDNGNVAIYDTTSGDFIKSLSQDIVEIECNSNGSVKVIQDNGSVEYFDPANVNSTQILPAAAIPFSGTCADLAELLSTDFFFVVSGGDDILYTIELIDALTVDFYAPYDLKINTVTDILNTPVTTIEDDGVPYVLTNTILAGSKVTVTVDTAAVVNLNITKA